MKEVRFLLYFFILFFGFKVFSFDTLSEAQKYVDSIPEITNLDNQDIFDPDFSTLFKSIGKKVSFLDHLRLKKILWSVNDFENLLISVSKQQYLNGYFGNYILKIPSLPQTTVIIFGSMHGALHSLVRCLDFLKRKGMIDDNFKIKKPDVYILFNGSLVSMSPYILEFFTLVLKIMQTNPDHVFYIKGRDENEMFWLNNGLKRELNFVLTNNKKREFLKQFINIFFNSLPLAFYLTGNPEDGVIRISHYGMDFAEINENSCLSILKNFMVHALEKCRLNPIKKKSSIVKAIIESEKFENYRQSRGLYTLAPDDGAFSWKIFSGPNFIYQKYFHFFYDSFVVVFTGTTLKEATITLYNRDVREKHDFKASETYVVTTTQKLNPKDVLDFYKEKVHLSKNSLKRIQKKLLKIQSNIHEISSMILDFKQQLYLLI